MSAPRRPTHLLLSIHSPMQQPLHRALGDCRRDRFFTPSSCRVIDNDIGLSRHICLALVQKSCHLACRGGNRRLVVGRGVHRSGGFANEIQSASDLTMPETPTDPFDRLSETSTDLAISLGGVGPTLGRLRDVLNPHREMKPIQYM